MLISILNILRFNTISRSWNCLSFANSWLWTNEHWKHFWSNFKNIFCSNFKNILRSNFKNILRSNFKNILRSNVKNVFLTNFKNIFELFFFLGAVLPSAAQVTWCRHFGKRLSCGPDQAGAATKFCWHHLHRRICWLFGSQVIQQKNEKGSFG